MIEVNWVCLKIRIFVCCVLKLILKSVFIFRNLPKIVSFGKIQSDLAFAFEIPRGCFAFQIIDFGILESE